MSKWELGPDDLDVKHLPGVGWGLVEHGEVIAIWPTIEDMMKCWNDETKEDDDAV